MGFFSSNSKEPENENDIDSLLNLLNHKNPSTRLNAFTTLLKKLPDEELYDRLKILIDDPDKDVSLTAAIDLFEKGYKGSLEKFHSIIVQGKLKEKIKIIRALAENSENDNIDAVNILFIASNDRKVTVRLEALKALGNYTAGIVVKRLIDSLNSDNFQIRTAAVHALGQIGTDLVVDLLTGALIDKHPAVRKAAKESLETIDSDMAREALGNRTFMQLVKRMSEDTMKRQKMAQEIGRKEIYEGLPLICKTCFDEYKSVRIESTRSMGLFRDPETIDILEKVLDDKYYDVRIEALLALEKINSIKALEVIEKAKNDKNSNVKEQADKSYMTLRSRLEKKKILKNEKT